MTEKNSEELHYELNQLKTAMLVGCYLLPTDKHNCEEYLAELDSLSKTYGFEVVGRFPVHVRKIDAGTYIGSGKLEELSLEREKLGADVIIFDEEITPNQQRNLEKIFKFPVIDRAELILEVFAKHAQSREASLQIELARSRYQLPRLRRLWTHLSRQSGSGQLKGEGEQQIEIDRRIVKRRITSLAEELKEVHKQRSTQRQARLRSGIPLFAIVGYTNSGKSTLLHALTGSEVLIEDKLFATLDTATRKYTLSNGQPVLLIDTVGFIRKLPHHLVASFRSTLEESAFTDILLHVVDVSHPRAMEHAETTYAVLKELEITGKPIITVLNKADQCEDRSMISRLRIKYPKTVVISATTREGLDELADKMIQEIQKLRISLNLRVPQSQYALVSEILRDGRVIESDYEGNDILLKVEVPAHLAHRVKPFEVGYEDL